MTAIRALGKYEGALETLIHGFKYRQQFAAKTVFGFLLDNCRSDDLDFCRYDLLVPVPLHKKRLRERGFNQAVVLADLLRKKYKVPLARAVLQRTVYTPPQVQLRGDARKKNVRRAFKASDPAAVRNKTILLVDDVYTTGATMNECARTLKQAGASRIDGFVMARAV
ncbi:MAG: ComF family protein [Deltaproteobacteria bacterium]|nr:ComF family protein [Deltaproteobacteria bacterium]